MTVSQHKKILIMAGGTGGHVFPGLSVASVLLDQGHIVTWMGTRAGIESRLVPDAGLPIYYIDIAGVRGKGIKSLLMSPLTISHAVLQSLRILIKEKPDAVLGMGGFVAGPGALAAKCLRIPLALHEQNAIAGTTNRVLYRLANQVFQAFDDTFPADKKVLTVGNPVRKNLYAREQYNQGRPLQVLVLGGSRGAKAINDILPDVAVADNNEIFIWHQTGYDQLDEVREKYKSAGQSARVDAFIDDMAEAYLWADLVICRAGAMTVSEIACAAVPAIFIPFPFAIDDHQTANANTLAKKDAAIVLQQKDMTVEKLAHYIAEFDQDREKMIVMGKNAQANAQPKAADTVAEKCLELCQ